jgi:predicted Zn-dependent protease
MRLGKRMRVALVVLVPVVAFLGYELGLFLYGNYHYRAAEQALDRRDFDDASAHLEKCLDVSPRELPTRLLAAQAARRRHDYEEARRQLYAFKQNKGPAQALESEYRLMRAQQGDLDEARLLLSFCEDHPDDPDTPMALEAAIEGSLAALTDAFSASLTFAGGPAEEYVVKVQRGADLWLRLRPGKADQVQGLVWRARAHAYTNDQLKAKEDARRALELDPDHFEARMELAFFLTQDAPAEAAEQLERLRERHPDNVQVRFALAHLRRSLGQLDQARQLLDELLAAQPKHLLALVERGRVALDAEQFDKAEQLFRRAFAQAPDDPAVNLALSDCLQKIPGRSTDAKEYHERFLKLEAEQQQRRRGQAIQAGRPAPGG